MKRLILLLFLMSFSMHVIGQDTTWFRDSGLPHEKVSGSAFMGANNNIFGYFYAKFWMGNPSQRLAEYDRAGNLLQFGSMPVGYWDFSTYKWLYLRDGSFLSRGAGTSPRSQNAHWGGFVVLHDSAKNLIMERTLSECNITDFYEASDTSFLALETANITLLTHFNTKGDTLWQIPYSQLLGISALDSTYSYNLLQMECIAGECLAWLKHKSIEQQLIFHFNPSTGIVSKRDTLNIVGFVKGNRLNEKGWDGYVFIYSDSSKSQKISFLNASFNSQWEIRQSANLGIDLKYAFINNDSDLVFSVWYSSKFRTYSTHTYSRIYAVDFTGNESFAAQYFDTIREYRCSPKHQFEDGGYLLNIQSYHHIAESFGSLIARSKIDGTVIDTAKERGWNGSGPFKDVPLFDPFADNTDTTNIGMKAFKNSYSLRIYPNPTSSTLYLELNSNQTVNYTLQNLNGQSLIEGRFVGSTQINTANLPNGIYFLHLHGDGVLVIRKVVVQR
ncbi:MAG: T9SS type A sorting domain-containing protein [Bacteroidetes bacterium]|nr:T9SS type A sorting domain-containing protein [Bacteroidota bacterium]